MFLLFLVNVIVVTLVTREFCQKVTEENPSERTEEEEKKTSELPAVELTTEEELLTKTTGQEVTQENPTTGTEEKTREPVDVELVTEEEEDAKGPISTTADPEVLKEDSRETTDEPGKAQKRTDSTDSETGEEGNKDDSAKLPKEQESGKQTEEADVEMISRGVSSPQEANALIEKPEMDSVQQTKPFYELKAALTAMWLPAVVGDKRKMFIAASLSTLITKILILLVSVILAAFFQENMHSRPFVLWSRVGKSLKYLINS